MDFVVNRNTKFLTDRETDSGIQKIAGCVRRDIELITDQYPPRYSGGKCESLICYGVCGENTLIEQLQEKKKIDYTRIKGKREVYLFQVEKNPMPSVEKALVIAGSDKRGTIYGLFHLSELLGVSPFVNWNHVWPEKREGVTLTDVNYVSKEPSVTYRGFFINDEWPAFGTWAQARFGGINAKCYEQIFELLLRLKGNYLWPAMWASDFNLDGPGLASAELAHEMGIVMSTSHHEPCMRSGNEYGKVRGKGSVYGDAWNFLTNREGITAFWRDGLKRNKHFENVITMGMRGENDTAILDKESTLSDNIQLLREVLKTQNELIKEEINENLDEVARQIVLFTEVEEFFYGNETIKGLIGSPELEGVTLMLSDNNVGAARTLPSEKMRDHKGGYGMYYHMDMHGGPYSFQWIGSTYLPKVWEQMTMAYEFGVREIWVTNIGDIGTQELGLSFFLDMAYDIDPYRGSDASVLASYTNHWVRQNFATSFTEEECCQMNDILWAYTGLLAKRKHEVMNADVFHPVHFGEADDVLQKSEAIIQSCDRLKKTCGKRDYAAFFSLIYYPACGTANLMKLWTASGKNHFYAGQGRLEANDYAEVVKNCLYMDEKMTEEYHQVDDKYFYGLGASEHIGFRKWNDEDHRYPVLMLVQPVHHPSMIVSRIHDSAYVTGGEWTDQPQVWEEAMRPDVEDILFDIASGGTEPVTYRLQTDCPWLSFSSMKGIVDKTERIRLHIHREKFTGEVQGAFDIIHEGIGKATITVKAANRQNITPDVFYENDGYIAMEASHFQRNIRVENGGFEVLEPYGRTGSAIKAFPVTRDFMADEERPYVEYDFMADCEEEYRIDFYMAATTPVTNKPEQYIAYAVNSSPVQYRNTVEDEERPFFESPQWRREALHQIKIISAKIACRKGRNVLRFYAASPAIVLERIVLVSTRTKLPTSYLGPKESFLKKLQAFT